ncbi:bifunctional alanine racemase/tRNA (adenosine(37)-N6)-threonylcarbamoyltransferase complex ATPase subunit type 1 TsaE [Corynebacterium auriscanis]|uniref:bifunctional alanine racemase/tRNA (adenosine(37)-N6)-threonylcarbamoyltransferase complex ATPase subunit type 1 TsaE n=1 Tax=Corynebacterium auriscanis TaxID=99807 RepID=UPI00069197E1|nr:bifunctional alanine racemase/tRNA (adenosine(37)-N6)-threonylcarbamoyltransferase complex ATPase subunit type 1 TsaE [Corynebacterium auriscanis]WJY73500.1 Alanine racemase [Corynebacterium auriscanis]
MYQPLSVPDEHALAEVVVDLSAIRANVSLFVDAASSAEVMTVVKADAYNHGAVSVARACLEGGATQLGTATVGEALCLREAGITAPITAWMWIPGEDLSAAVRAGITIGVPSLAHAESLVALAQRMAAEQSSDVTAGVEQPANPAAGAGQTGNGAGSGQTGNGAGIGQTGDGAGSNRVVSPNQPISITLMADTGLSRSGITPDQWTAVVELIAQHRDLLDVKGVMSHLASADDSARAAFTDVQNRRFHQAIEVCREHGIHPETNHIANTPAALTRPDLHHQMVRPGVGIYGIDPVVGGSGGNAAQLRPAITFRAKVITTKVIRTGESVSYGGTWTATRDTRTAVVAAGYADGVPRSASGNFQVGIGGKLYPQIGRVCMDQIVVNLGDAHEPTEVEPGQWATIFGEGGISASELAAAAGTIDYEILTMPRGSRVRRRWVGEEREQLSLAYNNGQATAPTPDDMREVGRRIGGQLDAGTVVVLTGPLGAGKTTLTQGIAGGLGVKGRVQSPTFTIVRTHKPGAEDRPGMLHMDAYRLLGADVSDGVEPGRHANREDVLDALEALDIDADLDRAVIVAEWGRGVVEELSNKVLDIEIDRAGDERIVRWEWR